MPISTVENSNLLNRNRIINVTVNCSGSNIGNGLGIGNGNQNGGGGSCEDNTPGQNCNNACNVICEQVLLEQFAEPTEVSRIGQEIVWTFRVTNISGTPINRPLVISSSVLGNILLSQEGLNPGQTISIDVRYSVTAQDLQRSSITSVAYVAYAVPPGLDVGTRISPIITTTVQVIIPKLEVNGSILVGVNPGGAAIDFLLNIKNIGSVAINHFEAYIRTIFGHCSQYRVSVGLLVLIVTDRGFTLALRPGAQILPGQSVTAQVIGGNCSDFCGTLGTHPCILDYNYSADQSALITRSVLISQREE